MNVRLIVYRPQFANSRCTVNNPGSNYPVTTSNTTIAVDNVDATTLFKAGDRLLNEAGSLYGVVKTVGGATSITLNSVQLQINDDVDLYYEPETQFELDLAEAPNIVVNYNWLDIKEPTQRKGSFSQTLKIPFSDRNNQFFENWFNVNLSSLVFD